LTRFVLCENSDTRQYGDLDISEVGLKKEKRYFLHRPQGGQRRKVKRRTQDMLSVLYEGVGRKQAVADFSINSSKGS